MGSSRKIEIQFSSGDTFREIFQGSAEGIIMVNRDGKILLANPVSERMFGYAEGQLVGLPMETLIPERYRAGHVHHRHDFNENPSPRRMGMGRDLMAIRKNGTEFPVEVSLSYKEINGQFLVVAFVIDITERKKSDEALRRSEEQLLIYAAELEKKVQTRTEALNQSIKELEKEIEVRKKAEYEAHKSLEKERELNELKSKFVSIASHEFRTPLSTVLSSASLIHQYKEKGHLDKLDKHINRIKSSVNHLTGILNDFLSLGKLEEGKVDMLPEPVLLSHFFHDIQDELKLSLKEKQTIELVIHGEEVPVYSDPRVLRNVFFNLISNASKYSGEGKKIQINIQFAANQVRIDIVDEGIGIPDSEIKHIFERFFRATNATNIQGSGLGLNIVKRYIELLNGDIRFTSEEEKGSTFSITLPIS
ncbi:MAG: PAS domain-containing sensor histidine kinase [Cyclobacteriaceae bacterium]|nr:PAS domain-containing sensor histidine kinase [Cyclobacteriaceae bacterium]